MVGMRDVDELFAALARSPFRSRFRLDAKDLAYLRERGLAEVIAHARRFLRERLGPAAPRNDGRQTPMRGHPVFVAQHATGTCCRGCLEKWHGIAKGRELTGEEVDHLVEMIRRWLVTRVPDVEEDPRQGTLFDDDRT
jgi:hypothetical protein